MYTETDTSQGHSSLAEEQWLGDAHTGDFDMGAGVSTSQLQNPSVTLNQTKGGTGAAGFFQSPTIWVLIIVVLVITKLLAEKAGKGDEFKTVKIGLENWFIVGALAATWIFAWKMISYLTKFGPAIQFFGFI